MRQKTADDLVKRLADDSELVRQCAVESVARLGATATPAIIKALSADSIDTQIGAARSLGVLGNAAVEATDSLMELTGTDNGKVRAAAIEALGNVNPANEEVVDAFVAALRSTDQDVHRAATEALVRTSPAIQAGTTELLVQLLSTNPDGEMIGRTAQVLGSFGPRASAAIVPLLQVLPRRPNQKEVSTAIGRIGIDALEPTFAALRTGKIDIEQVTGIVDGMPAQVKVRLAGEVADESPLVREVALLTISKLVPVPRNTVDLLIVGLGDQQSNVRRAAAESLRTLGKRGEPALAKLKSKTGPEQDPAARIAMLDAVCQLHERNDSLVEYLADNLGEHAGVVRAAALRQLAEFDELPESLYAPLAAQVTDEDPGVRAASTSAIVLIESKRDDAAKLIVAALDDEDQIVREKALLAAAQLGDAATAAVNVIRKQLFDDSEAVKIAALESLARIGESASSAFEDVSELGGDASSTVRMAVMKSLRKISEEPEVLLPVLIKGVEDSEWEVRRQAAQQLGEMEEDAAPAIPALLGMLRADDDSDAARQAIREINTAGEEAVPLLLEIIQDDDSGRRSKYYAIYLLRKMGSRARSALPVLRRLAEEADGKYVEYYERAIREIEEDDE